MSDLEAALRELDVDWPATPDLAAAVMTRIAADPRRAAAGGEAARGAGEALGGEAARGGEAVGGDAARGGGAAAGEAARGGEAAGGEAARGAAPARRRRRLPTPSTWRARLAYVFAAALVAVGGTLAASPAARSTVLEWLGLKSVKIERVEPKIGARLDLGPAIALPAGTRTPGVLGKPEAYDTSLPDGTHVVSLVYPGPILVQVFKARVSPFIQKTVGMGATVERVKDGYWIKGAHGFAYESPSGGTFEEQRVSDTVLLLERNGDLIRVEGNIPKARALEIANSMS
ncbi:hypothetical protein [Solirubrobacter soli]|uniref:hypothetical protein n=1 Tax=Solirubrobacter soli TaxID=363832 RepID=UPI000423C17F|nr:hypothetical protein [Solirubrobacter soli]